MEMRKEFVVERKEEVSGMCRQTSQKQQQQRKLVFEEEKRINNDWAWLIRIGQAPAASGM